MSIPGQYTLSVIVAASMALSINQYILTPWAKRSNYIHPGFQPLLFSIQTAIFAILWWAFYSFNPIALTFSISLIAALAFAYFKDQSTQQQPTPIDPFEQEVRKVLSQGEPVNAQALLEVTPLPDERETDKALAALKVSRLEEILELIDSRYVRPTVQDSGVLLQLLQAQLIERITEDATGEPPKEVTIRDSTIAAAQRLAQARQGLKNLPLEMALEDMKMLRKVFEEATKLEESQAAIEDRIEAKTRKEQAKISRQQRPTEPPWKRLVHDVAKDEETKRKVWEEFGRLKEEILASVKRGERKEKDAKRTIENIEDAIRHRLEAEDFDI